MEGREPTALTRNAFSGDTRKWEDLPMDCLCCILEKLEMTSLIEEVFFVCKSWYKASLNPQCWKILDLTDLIKYRMGRSVPKTMKRLLERSQGRTTKVKVEVSSTIFLHGILVCISESCPALKSLTIPCCRPKDIHNWKDLEFLYMVRNKYLIEVLAEISEHCKNFSSLTVGHYGNAIYTEEASAIVEFIPNIKYLSLHGTAFSSEDLLLILSKCRELQVLNIRNYRELDVRDADISRMASHIKCFRYQDFDSAYEFNYGSIIEPFRYQGGEILDDSDYGTLSSSSISSDDPVYESDDSKSSASVSSEDQELKYGTMSSCSVSDDPVYDSDDSVSSSFVSTDDDIESGSTST